VQKHGQARRDELRAEVLAVVERHLRAGTTFADLSVADVVAEAGISRSTFYAYFVDKPNLLRSWYDEFTDVVVGAAHQWWSLDGTATRTDVRRALEQIMGSYRPHPELMAATHEAIGTDHGVREAVETSMRRYIDGLRVHIEAGQAGGFIDASVPAGETAYWLQWMAERGLHMMGRSGHDTNADRMTEAYTAIVWNTLYAATRHGG
jgi:AcrR family transcriptional regulator